MELSETYFERFQNTPIWVNIANGTKRPISPITKSGTNWNTPENWGTFKAVQQNLNRSGNSGRVGLVLNQKVNPGVAILDLDHVRNPDTGEVVPWAQDILNDCKGYAEYSLSGSGIHVLVEANTKYQTGTQSGLPDWEGGDKANLEYFQTGKQVILTFDTVEGCDPKNVGLSAGYVESLASEKYPKLLKGYKGSQKTAEASKSFASNINSFDLSRWLEKYAPDNFITESECKEWNGDFGKMHVLNHCPWCDEHTTPNGNRDAVIFEREDGQLTFHCVHGHCVDRGWKDFRKFYEPGYDEGVTLSLTDDDITGLLSDPTKPTDVTPLLAITSAELDRRDIPPVEWVVPDILPVGGALLSAPSKAGKSWLALDLCVSVARGTPWLGKKTNQSKTLYLALEDSPSRLQDRQRKLFPGEYLPPGAFFVFSCESLENNFIGQIEDFLVKEPGIKLVVIDVFQKIRGGQRRNESAYGYDYREGGMIKDFALRNNICVLVITHHRKMVDTADWVNNISGSTGLTGCFDTLMSLNKKTRDDKQGVLKIEGKDVPSTEMVIRQDASCRWQYVGDYEALEKLREQEEFKQSPILEAFKSILEEQREWTGTASDLKKTFDIGDTSNTINRFCSSKREMFRVFGIDVSVSPSGNNRKIRVAKCVPDSFSDLAKELLSGDEL